MPRRRAPDHHHHPSARDRPRLPAAQEPGDPQPSSWPSGSARLLPGGDDERCTAALLLDVDPVGLVRGRAARARQLEQYVNDRPYVASSFLSVAIAQVFGTALAGRSKERPELAADAAPARGAARRRCPAAAARRCCGGCSSRSATRVTAERAPAGRAFPEWGESRYFTRRRCAATCRLRDLLAHLYVLIPVLDDDKHYWVGDDEVEKLLRHGEGWLAAHPERELIARRYLRHRRSLTRGGAGAAGATTRSADPERRRRGARPAEEAGRGARSACNEQRLGAVWPRCRRAARGACSTSAAARGGCCAAARTTAASRRSSGMDVSIRALEIARASGCASTACRDAAAGAASRCSTARSSTATSGSPASTPPRWSRSSSTSTRRGWPPSSACCSSAPRPAMVVLTTPNAEYNVQLRRRCPPASFRHATTASSGRARSSRPGPRGVAERFGYAVRFVPDRPGGPRASARRPRWRCSPRMSDRLTRSPSSRCVVLVGPSGSGKSHVRAQALQADRGAVVRLLPRPGLRRRERPVGDRTTPSRCCTSSPASGSPRPADRRRRDQRPAGGAQAAGRAGARATTCLPVAIVLDLPERAVPRAQPPRGRTAASGRTSSATRASSCAARCAACSARASATSSSCRSPEEVEAATIERQPLWNDRRDEHGPFDIIGDVHGCCDELRACC